MDELFDATAILQRYPRPPAGGAAIVTNSGAICALALDTMQDVGLPVACAPIDLGAAGYSDAGIFTRTTEPLVADPAVGSVIWAMTGGGPHQQRSKVEALIPLSRRTEKPLILTLTGDGSSLDPQFLQAVRDNEVAFFRSPERTLRAMAALHRHAVARDAERRSAVCVVPPLTGKGALTEYVGKAWLRELGVPVPQGQLVQTLEQAQDAARTIGFPVVIKAQAASLHHKSDVGGVVVGIKTPAELSTAWESMVPRLGALDGVLVERMASAGLEMVVGAKNDPRWGPIILVGLGGVWIEALRAVEFLPPDISHARAVERINAMKGAALLGPFRGQPPRDVSALAYLVLTLGNAMRAQPSIVEIDINPVMVFAQGAGVLALDALVVKEE